MEYQHGIKVPHNTKHAVKLLSGQNKGAVALFDTAESAKAECFYVSDVHGLCPARYEPLFVTPL